MVISGSMYKSKKFKIKHTDCRSIDATLVYLEDYHAHFNAHKTPKTVTPTFLKNLSMFLILLLVLPISIEIF